MTADTIGAPTIRVSCIIINSQEEILLAKHVKKNKEYWVLPGGHLEFGETIEECALRELKEETNLNAEFERIVFTSESIAPDNSRHIINFFVLLINVSGEIKICSDEDILKEVSFIKLSKIQDLTVYPDIKSEICTEHKQNWTLQNIKMLETPWA